MPKVAVAMQENFHWIPNGGKLYLVMYNAGGRGTGSTINQYTQILDEKNIDIIQQVTRSPETNFLDPKVCITIQTSVKKVHRGKWCTHDAMAKSVSGAWNKSLSVKTFKNIHGRFQVVLVCVVGGKGSNELAEKKPGKFFLDSTILNDEIGSDGSVEMLGITTTILQDKYLEYDEDIDDL